MTTIRTSMLVVLLGCAILRNALAATTFSIDLVQIEEITIFQNSIGSHLAGNMEVKVKGGFVLPSGASCSDRLYITTLKNVDADKRMLLLLTTAQVTKQRVNLFLTDDPATTAYPARCSLIGVTLTQ